MTLFKPESFTPNSCQELICTLKSYEIDHVIMMSSKFSLDGPCSTGIHVRRMNKLLLNYVARTNARLSILFEAEKLLSQRRGWPVVSATLPDEYQNFSWTDLVESGRVSIVTAISPDMTRADIQEVTFLDMPCFVCKKV